MRLAGARTLLGGLWLGALVLAGGCGERTPSTPTAPSGGEVNRTTWNGVFQGALDALNRQDLDALLALLSPVGRQTLEQDLRTFCALLANPTEAPRLMAMVRERWPEVPAELVERARAGELRAGWQLFMRAATPHGVAPRQAGMRLDPQTPDEAQVFYRYGDGPEQPIELKRVKGFWAVEKLALGSH